MKKDIDTLIAEERADTISKYDKGRQEGVCIDPWEDADYSIYKVTDRFGFLHEKELPTPSVVEEKQKQQEIDRVEKWLKMVKNWNKYKNSDKLVKRVYKGIPLQLRGQAWALLLEIDKVKKDNEGKYEKMKLQARNFSTEIKQIDLDVNRTFRNHIMFMDRFGLKQQALFHVLAAYSVYNTEVSYCQGMSQIAAILLMYLNEEDAFWALSQLLTDSKHAMHGFFIPGFPKLQRFQAHHERILSKMLPKLRKHLVSDSAFRSSLSLSSSVGGPKDILQGPSIFQDFSSLTPASQDKEQMSCGVYTTKWFLQCFIDRSPFTLTLRLWDIYILEGEKMLTAMAYTTLKLHKKRLLRFQLEDLREFLQEQLAASFLLPDDVVVEQLQAAMSELRSKKLHQPPPGKSEELPKKPLGQERPILLLPLQRDSPLEVKSDLQPRSRSNTESITEAQDSRSPSSSSTLSLRSPDPAAALTKATSSPSMPCRAPPLPPKPAKPCAEVNDGRDVKESEKTQGGKLCGSPDVQEEPIDWPPPPDELNANTDEMLDLPDLPPPPLLYPTELEQKVSPPAQHRSPPKLAVPLKPSPKTLPKPFTSPARGFTASSSPRLAPPKPTKFPVSLYVPASSADRRPSNTSQYDNLSEADDDDRCPERLLGSAPEEVSFDRDYDPARYPLPPPPIFIPPSPSPLLPSRCALPCLPQEPEYEEEDRWAEDSVIIPPPPPSFADRLSPLRCHRATSPGAYSKAFSRGPRDRSAFPAPLLYTRSPPGQSALWVPDVGSSPDFCGMPPGGRRLPKSITF